MTTSSKMELILATIRTKNRRLSSKNAFVKHVIFHFQHHYVDFSFQTNTFEKFSQTGKRP